MAANNAKLSRLEACMILYKGQSNVKQMANRLEISLEEMQKEFKAYVERNPITEDAWRKDIELSWPYSGC